MFPLYCTQPLEQRFLIRGEFFLLGNFRGLGEGIGTTGWETRIVKIVYYIDIIWNVP